MPSKVNCDVKFIIIIIIIIIAFIRGVYNYKPGKNYVSRMYGLTAIL